MMCQCKNTERCHAGRQCECNALADIVTRPPDAPWRFLRLCGGCAVYAMRFQGWDLLDRRTNTVRTVADITPPYKMA